MKNINLDFKPEDFLEEIYLLYNGCRLAIPALSTIPVLNCAHGRVFKDLRFRKLTELEKYTLPKISLPPVVEMVHRHQWFSVDHQWMKTTILKVFKL